MASREKPARLWLFPEHVQNGVTRRATWYIRHCGKKVSTGCLEDDRAGAETSLTNYMSELHSKTVIAFDKRAKETKVSDVIAHYAKEKKVARPKELATRLSNLLAF